MRNSKWDEPRHPVIAFAQQGKEGGRHSRSEFRKGDRDQMISLRVHVAEGAADEDADSAAFHFAALVHG